MGTEALLALGAFVTFTLMWAVLPSFLHKGAKDTHSHPESR